jgi:predicted nucleic acid-binding protein
VALILAAVARATSARIAFWDGLIVEAALAAGCARLLTEDLQDGRDFDGLRVVNPFTAQAANRLLSPRTRRPRESP